MARLEQVTIRARIEAALGTDFESIDTIAERARSTRVYTSDHLRRLELRGMAEREDRPFKLRQLYPAAFYRARSGL